MQLQTVRLTRFHFEISTAQRSCELATALSVAAAGLQEEPRRTGGLQHESLTPCLLLLTLAYPHLDPLCGPLRTRIYFFFASILGSQTEPANASKAPERPWLQSKTAFSASNLAKKGCKTRPDIGSTRAGGLAVGPAWDLLTHFHNYQALAGRPVCYQY